MDKTMYIIVFSGDTVADYTVYEDKEVAKSVMLEKYSNYDCNVLHLPFMPK